MNRSVAPSAILAVFATLAVPAVSRRAVAQTPTPPTAVRPHDQAPTAIAARRNGQVQIDGRMDEAAWQAAPPVTDFRQLDPNEGQPVSERTEARILVDDDAVYVGMRLYDREPRLIQPQLARRDEPIEGDLVEVTFDSYHEHLSAVIFRVSAGGAKRDATVSNNGNQDNTWDAVWDGAATVDSLGWTAEFRIPLLQLRYNRNLTDQVWGLQLGRKIARKAEVAYFAFTPKTQQQGINRYGHLTGLGRLPSIRKIELVPYELAKNENPGFIAANDPFRKRNNIAPVVGVDMKAGLTSNMTLNATFNPDFGQVEVDPAVVNLSAFETFFPERRPFFIENANAFGFGNFSCFFCSNVSSLQMFYTRRIGRAPQLFPAGTYVDTPENATILGAGKITGRTSNNYRIGVLDAVTKQEKANVIAIDAATGERSEFASVAEPLTNYFVARSRKEFLGGQYWVGGIATATDRFTDDSLARPRLSRNARELGFDWYTATKDR